MGELYRALDTRLGRAVALRFLPGESPDLARLGQAARLSHPNIHPVYEVREEGGEVFVAMAPLDGETLAERIGRGPLPLGLAVTVAVQIADGLEEAQRNGLAHGDLKPANVIVNGDGRAAIFGFGMPGTREGDVWALGAMLYEMLEGRRATGEAEIRNASDGVRRVVARAMAEDPKDRFQSAGEMAAALRELQMGRSLVPTPPKKRRRWVFWGVLAAALRK